MERQGVCYLMLRHGLVAIFLTLIMLTCFTNPVTAREPYRIKVFAPPAHTATYAIGVGIADIINKNSSWLKASVVEGKSPSENTKRIVTNPKLRKTVIWHLTEPNHWEALQNFPMFEKINYDFGRIRYVFPISIVLNAFITLDPKIKSFKDLKGKRICCHAVPVNTAEKAMAFYCLEQVGVSKSDIKMEYMHYKPSHIALMDGLLDAVSSGGAMMGLPDKWVISPFAVEVIDTRKTYFIDYDPKILEKMREEIGNPFYPMTIPANTFRNQTDLWQIAAKYMAWSVTDEMPEEVVEEILNVVYQNIGKFGDYHPMGKFLTPDSMGIMGKNIKFYHPVSLRLLKEKGIRTGLLQ